MKKLIVGHKWKAHLASRSRSQLKANARSKNQRRERAARAYGHHRPKHFTKEARVTGPEVFSLIQNPVDTIAFFREMRSVAEKRNLYVDLSGVKTMTSDAIAGLLATIHYCKSLGARARGNVPTEPQAEQMLNNSGFRTYVHSSPGSQYTSPMGRIEKFTKRGEAFQNKFDQNLARRIIEFATLKLTGTARANGVSYSVFCEAMLNTLNHASGPNAPREPWWASVYYDSDRNRACFTFLDQGVGIFNSRRLAMRLKLLVHLRSPSSGELLKLLFRGAIPSTTGVLGRGNGIPRMYEHCKAGRIRNLIILSNNAVGNAEEETYRVLPRGFEGTLLYWEI